MCQGHRTKLSGIWHRIRVSVVGIDVRLFMIDTILPAHIAVPLRIAHPARSACLKLLIMGLLATCLCTLYVIILAFETTRRLFTRQHLFHDGLRSISSEQSRTVKFRRPF